MAEVKQKEIDEELIERFDTFIRSTLLKEGNKLRAEKGYPLLRRLIWRTWLRFLH